MPQKNQKQKMLIISGPSGVGKSTVCAHLLKVFPDNLKLSVSETTRTKRHQEEHGKHYIYITQEAFQKRVERFHYLEWFAVYNNFYGTPRKQIFDMINCGIIPLMDIDIQGKLRMVRLFPDHLSIFIAPPDMEQLKLRLLGRSTDTVSDIENRLKQAEDEMKLRDTFHKVLINDELESVLEKAEKIVAEYIHD